jgi:hypothetical protein
MSCHIFKTLAALAWIAIVEFAWGSTCSGQSLPEPTGVYAVGRTNYQLVGPSRVEDQGTGKEQNREFIVQVWYPARSKTEGKPAPWIPADRMQLDEKGFVGMLLKRSSEPAASDIPKALAAVVVHAREECPLAAAPKSSPVLVFSSESDDSFDVFLPGRGSGEPRVCGGRRWSHGDGPWDLERRSDECARSVEGLAHDSGTQVFRPTGSRSRGGLRSFVWGQRRLHPGGQRSAFEGDCADRRGSQTGGSQGDSDS